MQYKQPPRLKAGDKVAIVSPSAGLASIFPWVYELGLKRLKELFKLNPIEFPTARASNEYLRAHPKERAHDINQAFSDPEIKAIIATTGGNDQIRILPYLDAEIIKAHPKIFLGYSDNTNLHLYLYKLGIISYYGGGIMMQFAMQGEMHSYTVNSLNKSLFEPRIGIAHPSDYFTDQDLDWAKPELLDCKRQMEKNSGWRWHGKKEQAITGRLWGGCLEILIIHLALKTYLPDKEELEQIILYVETSEEMPGAGEVYRFFATLGELKILHKFKAILVGRPKAQFLDMLPPEGREQYIINQEAAIKEALRDYAIHCPVVFNMDFGHTDPQIILSNGGMATVDSIAETIIFE